MMAGQVATLSALLAVAVALGWLVSSASRPSLQEPAALVPGVPLPPAESVDLRTRVLTSEELARLEVGSWQLAGGFLFADVFNHNDRLDVTEVTIRVAGKTLRIPTLLFAGTRGTIDFEVGPAIPDGVA